MHGCDEYSGARELVTALLEEPFAPDARKDSIRRRWREGPQNTERTITSVSLIYSGTQEVDPSHSYGFAPSEHPASVRVPSTWLQQFPVPIEVCELPIVPLRNVSSSASYRTLFSSDVPIIVCNPVSTPLASLRSELSLILNHANAILVVVCSAESSAPYAEYLSKQFPQPLSVVFVDPSRALSAIRTLSAEPGSSIAVQRYQDNYAASGISKFTSLLQDKLSVTSAGGISALYAASAREQIRASLCACYNTLKSAERDVDAATVSSITLRDSVVELEARVGAEVLGGDSVSEVKKALARAKVEVKAVMDRLTWWRCVWRIDDIGDTVKTAVDKAWCRELEDRVSHQNDTPYLPSADAPQLIFHSGRLAASQDCLAKSTRTLLASYKPPSPLHSPVLQNTLLQIQSSPSYSVTPSALTSPVHARKMQLAYPTNMLHSTAQRVTLGMGMSVLAGFGTAWAGWADKLGILGDAMATGLELETAIGTGMLMSTLGVWWMVGRWEKAKRRWWKDWDRIGEGLERDLKVSFGLRAAVR